MFHKIAEVTTLPDLKLVALFTCGEKRIYDVGKLCDKWSAFVALQTVPGLFSTVKVDAGGYGISWNDDVDLASEEIWQHGENPDC